MTLTFVRVGVRSTNNTKASWTAPIVRITRINMDIVYTVKDCVHCEELNYSLRSLENLPHDKVFIVGCLPGNVNKKSVIHIPSDFVKNKYKSTTHNLILACKDERVSENFIWMNDDFFILRPIEYPERELNLHRGRIAEVYCDYISKYGKDGPYVTGIEETAQFIIKLGIHHPKSYELHVPMVFNKKKVLEMLFLPGIEKIGVLHKRTLYGNLYMTGGKGIEDVKYLHGEEFKPKAGSKFLSSDDLGFPVVLPFLRKTFPFKSIYEV